MKNMLLTFMAAVIIVTCTLEKTRPRLNVNSTANKQDTSKVRSQASPDFWPADPSFEILP